MTQMQQLRKEIFDKITEVNAIECAIEARKQAAQHLYQKEDMSRDDLAKTLEALNALHVEDMQRLNSEKILYKNMCLSMEDLYTLGFIDWLPTARVVYSERALYSDWGGSSYGPGYMLLVDKELAGVELDILRDMWKCKGVIATTVRVDEKDYIRIEPYRSTYRSMGRTDMDGKDAYKALVAHCAEAGDERAKKIDSRLNRIDSLEILQ